MSTSAFSRRSLLGGALGVAALGALSACGSNKGAGSASSSSSPAAGGPKVTIEQWYHQYGESGTQAAAKKYAAGYPDATVNVQWIPGDYPAKLATGLSSDKGPDAFEGHPDRAMVASQQLVALDDLIADVKDDFDPADIAYNSVDGKLYSIPMINDPQVFFYRKSLLEAKGIKPPTTFDELISAAKELTDDKVKGAFLGNDLLTAGGPVGYGAVYATGGRWLTEDNKVGFDPDAVGEAVAKLRQFGTDKSVLLGAPTDWWDPGAINDSLVAIQWQGMWALPAMQEALGDDIGVFALPAASSSGKQAVVTSGWSAFVSAKSDQVDAAKAFTKWLWVDSVDLQEDWSLNYGFHIPPRKSVAEKATKLQEGVAAETVALNTQFGVRGNANFTPAMQTAYNDAVARIVGKGADPSTEMAKAVTKINSELDKLFG